MALDLLRFDALLLCVQAFFTFFLPDEAPLGVSSSSNSSSVLDASPLPSCSEELKGWVMDTTTVLALEEPELAVATSPASKEGSVRELTTDASSPELTLAEAGSTWGNTVIVVSLAPRDRVTTGVLRSGATDTAATLPEAMEVTGAKRAAGLGSA